MTYELEFDPRALKEWSKLGETVKKQFKKKLAGVLVNPGSNQPVCIICLIATK